MNNLTNLDYFYFGSISCVSYLLMFNLVIGLELVRTWFEPQVHWICHGLLACGGTWLYQLIEESWGLDYHYCTSRSSPTSRAYVFLLFVWGLQMAIRKDLWGLPPLDLRSEEVAWCHDLMAYSTCDGLSSSSSSLLRLWVGRNVVSPLGRELCHYPTIWKWQN